MRRPPRSGRSLTALLVPPSPDRSLAHRVFHVLFLHPLLALTLLQVSRGIRVNADFQRPKHFEPWPKQRLGDREHEA